MHLWPVDKILVETVSKFPHKAFWHSNHFIQPILFDQNRLLVNSIGIHIELRSDTCPGIHIEPSPDTWTGKHIEHSPDTWTGKHIEPSPDTCPGIHIEPSSDTCLGIHIEPSSDTWTGIHIKPRKANCLEIHLTALVVNIGLAPCHPFHLFNLLPWMLSQHNQWCQF